MRKLPRSSHVLYAKALGPVARFYQRTLALPLIEEDDEFVVLGDEALELVLVRIPDAIAASIEISTPPLLREDTPLKSSFQVDDLARVAAEAVAAGGGIKALASAWEWRGQRHLDGHDPEGNVVQFRQPV